MDISKKTTTGKPTSKVHDREQTQGEGQSDAMASYTKLSINDLLQPLEHRAKIDTDRNLIIDGSNLIFQKLKMMRRQIQMMTKVSSDDMLLTKNIDKIFNSTIQLFLLKIRSFMEHWSDRRTILVVFNLNLVENNGGDGQMSNMSRYDQSKLLIKTSQKELNAELNGYFEEIYQKLVETINTILAAMNIEVKQVLNTYFFIISQCFYVREEFYVCSNDKTYASYFIPTIDSLDSQKMAMKIHFQENLATEEVYLNMWSYLVIHENIEKIILLNSLIEEYIKMINEENKNSRKKPKREQIEIMLKSEIAVWILLIDSSSTFLTFKTNLLRKKENKAMRQIIERTEELSMKIVDKLEWNEERIFFLTTSEEIELEGNQGDEQNWLILNNIEDKEEDYEKDLKDFRFQLKQRISSGYQSYLDKRFDEPPNYLQKYLQMRVHDKKDININSQLNLSQIDGKTNIQKIENILKRKQWISFEKKYFILEEKIYLETDLSTFKIGIMDVSVWLSSQLNKLSRCWTQLCGNKNCNEKQMEKKEQVYKKDIMMILDSKIQELEKVEHLSLIGAIQRKSFYLKKKSKIKIFLDKMREAILKNNSEQGQNMIKIEIKMLEKVFAKIKECFGMQWQHKSIPKFLFKINKILQKHKLDILSKRNILEQLKMILFNSILRKMIEPEIKERLVSAFLQIDVKNQTIIKIFDVYEKLMETNEIQELGIKIQNELKKYTPLRKAEKNFIGELLKQYWNPKPKIKEEVKRTAKKKQKNIKKKKKKNNQKQQKELNKQKASKKTEGETIKGKTKKSEEELNLLQGKLHPSSYKTKFLTRKYRELLNLIVKKIKQFDVKIYYVEEINQIKDLLKEKEEQNEKQIVCFMNFQDKICEGNSYVPKGSRQDTNNSEESSHQSQVSRKESQNSDLNMESKKKLFPSHLLKYLTCHPRQQLEAKRYALDIYSFIAKDMEELRLQVAMKVGYEEITTKVNQLLTGLLRQMDFYHQILSDLKKKNVKSRIKIIIPGLKSIHQRELENYSIKKIRNHETNRKIERQLKHSIQEKDKKEALFTDKLDIFNTSIKNTDEFFMNEYDYISSYIKEIMIEMVSQLYMDFEYMIAPYDSKHQIAKMYRTNEIDKAIVKDPQEVEKLLLLGVPLVYMANIKEQNLWFSIDHQPMNRLNEVPERELLKLMNPLPRDAPFEEYYKKALFGAFGYVYEQGLTPDKIDVELIVQQIGKGEQVKNIAGKLWTSMQKEVEQKGGVFYQNYSSERYHKVYFDIINNTKDLYLFGCCYFQKKQKKSKQIGHLCELQKKISLIDIVGNTSISNKTEKIKGRQPVENLEQQHRFSDYGRRIFGFNQQSEENNKNELINRLKGAIIEKKADFRWVQICENNKNDKYFNIQPCFIKNRVRRSLQYLELDYEPIFWEDLIEQYQQRYGYDRQKKSSPCQGLSQFLHDLEIETDLTQYQKIGIDATNFIVPKILQKQEIFKLINDVHPEKDKSKVENILLELSRIGNLIVQQCLELIRSILEISENTKCCVIFDGKTLPRKSNIYIEEIEDDESEGQGQYKYEIKETKKNQSRYRFGWQKDEERIKWRQKIEEYLKNKKRHNHRNHLYWVFFNQIVYTICQICNQNTGRLNRLECFVAPYQADPQIVQFFKEKKIHAVYTDDYQLSHFGVPQIFRRQNRWKVIDFNRGNPNPNISSLLRHWTKVTADVGQQVNRFKRYFFMVLCGSSFIQECQSLRKWEMVAILLRSESQNDFWRIVKEEYPDKMVPKTWDLQVKYQEEAAKIYLIYLHQVISRQKLKEGPKIPKIPEKTYVDIQETREPKKLEKKQKKTFYTLQYLHKNDEELIFSENEKDFYLGQKTKYGEKYLTEEFQKGMKDPSKSNKNGQIRGEIRGCKVDLQNADQLDQRENQLWFRLKLVKPSDYIGHRGKIKYCDALRHFKHMMVIAVKS